jgi:MFS family permease
VRVLHDVLPARPEARRLLAATLASAIGRGMTLPFLFIYLTDVRHLDPTVVGFVVAWMGLMALVLAVPGGTLIDRFGPRRVVLPLYVVNAVGLASWGWAHSAWQAFGSATLCAIGMAVIWAAQNTIMTTVTGEAERQHVFGLSFAILNLGIGAGGVIAGFIADVHHPASFQVLYLTDAATLLVPAAILLSMPQVGLRVAGHGAPAHEHGGYRAVFADVPFRRYLIFLLVLTGSGYAQMEVGLPAFASDVSGLSTRLIAWALAANTVTIVVAQLGVLRWLHGRSRSLALAGVGVLMGAAWLLLGLGAWGRSIGAALPVLGLLLCSCVFALGETLLSPVRPALTNVLAPDSLRGRYNAMGSMIWGLTGVVGPLTAAPLIGHGYGEVWVVLVVAGCLVAALLALSLRRLLTPHQDGTGLIPVPEHVPVAG